MVTGMLQVFSINVSSLLDLGSTLSFVTPMVPKEFFSFTNTFNQQFMVTTPVSELVVAKMVYRNCPIMFLNRVSHVKLVELNMVDFDVILGMNWLHACFASIDCRTRMMKFNFPNEPVLEWKGGKIYS